MVNVIVGDNSAGKTFHLCKIYQDNSNVLSNLFIDKKTMYVKLSDEKIDALKNNMVGIVINGLNETEITSVLYEYNDGEVELSSGANKLISILLKEGSICLIDEPEYNLSFYECQALTEVLRSYESNDVWITTHYSTFACIKGARYFLADGDNIREISEDEAYEYVD